MSVTPISNSYHIPTVCVTLTLPNSMNALLSSSDRNAMEMKPRGVLQQLSNTIGGGRDVVR